MQKLKYKKENSWIDMDLFFWTISWLGTVEESQSACLRCGANLLIQSKPELQPIGSEVAERYHSDLTEASRERSKSAYSIE